MSFYSSQGKIQVQRERLYMSYFIGSFLTAAAPAGRVAALKTRLEDILFFYFFFALSVT